MNDPQKIIKKPASEITIFKNMMKTVFTVSSVFFAKNLIGNNWQSAIMIGICLILFTSVVFIMKKKNTSEYNKTTDWQVSKNLIGQRGIQNEL